MTPLYSLRYRMGLVVVMILVSGCQTPVMAPARLTAPTDLTCQAALQSFAQRVTGKRVTIGPEAFLTSSSLLLEPRRGRDAQGRPLDTMMLDRPERLTLSMDAESQRCEVRHEGSQTHEVLPPSCLCQR